MLFLLALDELENKERHQIERLYREHSSRVKKMAESIINDKTHTDDIVNETFVKVIRYKEKFLDVTEDEKLRMLIIITRSVCFNYLKKRKKLRFEPIDHTHSKTGERLVTAEPSSDFDLLKTLVSKETADVLMEAINNLKNPAREIILLKYYYEMKNVEIAEFFGMKSSTVASIIRRSICRLREELGGYLNDTDK